jgi:hypothetical protein
VLDVDAFRRQFIELVFFGGRKDMENTSTSSEKPWKTKASEGVGAAQHGQRARIF